MKYIAVKVALTRGASMDDGGSLMCRFEFDGRQFHVQSAALPPFAVDALREGGREHLRAGLTSEGITTPSLGLVGGVMKKKKLDDVAFVVDSLPWSNESTTTTTAAAANAVVVGGGGGGEGEGEKAGAGKCSGAQRAKSHMGRG